VITADRKISAILMGTRGKRLSRAHSTILDVRPRVHPKSEWKRHTASQHLQLTYYRWHTSFVAVIAASNNDHGRLMLPSMPAADTLALIVVLIQTVVLVLPRRNTTGADRSCELTRDLAGLKHIAFNSAFECLVIEKGDDQLVVVAEGRLALASLSAAPIEGDLLADFVDGRGAEIAFESAEVEFAPDLFAGRVGGNG
jgi:hypothetical protein